MNCTLTPLFPETAACSGRGTCVASTCLCDDPTTWTGVGDFVKGARGCDINIKASQALWALVSIANALAFAWCVAYLRAKIVRLPKRTPRAVVAASGLPLGWLVLMATASLVALGALRASDPTGTPIGTDVAATVLLALASGGFWSAVPVYISTLLALNVKQARIKDAAMRERMHRAETVLTRALPPLWLITVVACFCAPLAMLGTNDAGLTFSLASAHYLLLALNMLLYALLATAMVQPLIRDLRDAIGGAGGGGSAAAASPSLKGDSAPSGTTGTANSGTVVTNNSNANAVLKDIADSLQVFIRDLHQQAGVNLVVALFFGCWPFLQRQASLQLPVAWLSAALVMANTIRTVYPRSALAHARNGPSSPQGSSTGSGKRGLRALGGAISPRVGGVVAPGAATPAGSTHGSGSAPANFTRQASDLTVASSHG